MAGGSASRANNGDYGSKGGVKGGKVKRGKSGKTTPQGGPGDYARKNTAKGAKLNKM